MSTLPFRRLLAGVVAATSIVAAAVSGVAAPASAASDTALPDSYALFQSTPLAATDLPDDAVVLPIPVTSSEQLAYDRRGARIVSSAAEGTVQAQIYDVRTSETISVFDLTPFADVVESALVVRDESLTNVNVSLYVHGEKAGVPVLVRVTSTSMSLADATAANVSSTAVDPTRLDLLGIAGSGLIAVSHDDAGVYTAQRVSLALEPIRTAVQLPFTGERTFVMAPSTGNLIAAAADRVDLVSIYDPTTVLGVDVPGLGLAVRAAVADDTVALADADGDVAYLRAGYGEAPSVIGTLDLDAGASALNISSSLRELQVLSADGHSLSRIATADGAVRETRTFDGIRILPGAYASGFYVGARASFLAEAGGVVYRYSDEFLRRPVINYSSIGSVTTAGDATSFAVSVYSSGTTTVSWEYSLDGGEHWAVRGDAWASAIADIGTVTEELGALPDPLDGLAPTVRQQVDESKIGEISYSRFESHVTVAQPAFSGLWRVRASNELGSSASAPTTIEVTGPVVESPAPRVTKHPVSVIAVDAQSVSFTATATGDPEPTVRWERSADGTTWTTVANATATTLTLRAELDDDGTQYRAVFENASGTATTEAAKLSVSPLPAPAVGAAPEGAVVATAASLGLDLSNYSHEWLRDAAGASVSLGDNGFVFGEGQGWTDPATGATQLVWEGVAIYRPYGGLNGLRLTIANPYLAIDGDGRGTLTADVSWNNGGGTAVGVAVESDGFQRVILATFAEGDVVVSADGAVTFTATPEWADRPYVKPGLADATEYASSYPASFVDWVDDALRGWFLATGSGRDAQKQPNAVTASFSASTDAASSAGTAIDPADPLGDGVYPFADSAPVVTGQPDSLHVTAGEDATLAAAASGYPVPSVQWQRLADGAWTDIEGATAAGLVITDVPEGVHELRAVFTNRRGTAVTDAVTITAEAVIVTPTPTASPTASPDGGTAPSAVPAAPVAEGSLLAESDRGEVLVAFDSDDGITVSALNAGAWYHLYAYSEPVSLGWFRADSDGVVRTVLPSGFAAGAHRLAVLDATGALVGWGDFTVAEATTSTTTVSGSVLADTGGEVQPIVPAVAIGLLLAGVAAVAVAVRRRRIAGDAG